MAIMINVTPSDEETEETISAIRFGQRALLIKQKAEKHEVRDYKALYLNLQNELEHYIKNNVEALISKEKDYHQNIINNKNREIEFLEAENLH